MPPIKLEDFGDRDDPARAPAKKASKADLAPSAPVDPQSLERIRLEGYEDGYRAGWDDATKQEADEKSRIGAEFARNLQDLGFTFHEARAHVMQALEPLLAGMVEKVLPQLVSQTIGQTIVEELMPLAAEAADAPIDVVVAPGSREVLEQLLKSSAAVPFHLIEEPTLAEGQVYLRTGKLERHIDMTQAVDRIGAAINGLYDLNEKAFQNG